MSETKTLPSARRQKNRVRATGSGEQGLANFIGYNLKRTLSLVQSDLVRVLQDFDLRVISFSALAVIVHEQGINQTSLAATLSIERTNLVQIIDELAVRDLVARTPVASDRRHHALMPTLKGIKLLGDVQSAVVQHERRVFGILSGSERSELVRLLQKVRAHLEPSEPV